MCVCRQNLKEMVGNKLICLLCSFLIIGMLSICSVNFVCATFTIHGGCSSSQHIALTVTEGCGSL